MNLKTFFICQIHSLTTMGSPFPEKKGTSYFMSLKICSLWPTLICTCSLLGLPWSTPVCARGLLGLRPCHTMSPTKLVLGHLATRASTSIKKYTGSNTWLSFFSLNNLDSKHLWLCTHIPYSLEEFFYTQLDYRANHPLWFFCIVWKPDWTVEPNWPEPAPWTVL